MTLPALRLPTAHHVPLETYEPGTPLLATCPACSMMYAFVPPHLHRFAVILSGIFAFLMFGIDEIGVQIEEPFGCVVQRSAWLVRAVQCACPSSAWHWCCSLCSCDMQPPASSSLQHPASGGGGRHHRAQHPRAAGAQLRGERMLGLLRCPARLR